MDLGEANTDEDNNNQISGYLVSRPHKPRKLGDGHGPEGTCGTSGPCLHKIASQVLNLFRKYDEDAKISFCIVMTG